MMPELQSRDDIVIPFDRIGDPGWIEATRPILQECVGISFDADEMPPPVPEEDIVAAHRRLGAFPEPLALFYRTFGVADVGEYLLPPEEMKPLAESFADTEWMHANMSSKELKILPDLVVFGDYLGNGNMFCFHRETMEVWYFDHDDPPMLTRLFERVDDYLKGCLIKVQGVFFDDPDLGERETDAILCDLFGKPVVLKWMY